jgi:hypothetical protein
MRRLALLFLAIAALAAPAHASASESSSSSFGLPGSSVLSHLESKAPPADTFRSGFRLETDSGYDVQITTFGTAIFLIVSKGKFGERFVGTAYLARGVAEPEHLRATFGEFGEVSMRFRESHDKSWLGKRRNCRGAQRFVKRRGVFVGNLRFEDERGDLSLQVHRAKGSVVTVAQKCLQPRRRGGFLSAKESSRQIRSVFLALDREGVDFTGFLALERGSKTTFMATHEETRGKLAITQIAVVRSNQSPAVRVDEALTRAGVSPPAPFHGTGRYRAAPDGTTTWTGNLSVNFPGTPRYPLTGPQFDTLLEAAF